MIYFRMYIDQLTEYMSRVRIKYSIRVTLSILSTKYKICDIYSIFRGWRVVNTFWSAVQSSTCDSCILVVFNSLLCWSMIQILNFLVLGILFCYQDSYLKQMIWNAHKKQKTILFPDSLTSTFHIWLYRSNFETWQLFQ